MPKRQNEGSEDEEDSQAEDPDLLSSHEITPSDDEEVEIDVPDQLPNAIDERNSVVNEPAGVFLECKDP